MIKNFDMSISNFFSILYFRRYTRLMTKVMLAEFGQPKPAEIRPVESLVKNYETIKYYKMTEKPSNISIFFIK